MSKSRPFFGILNVGQIALAVFGLYISLSLFEVWAFVPFWVKNLALFTSLGVVYFWSKQVLKKAENQKFHPGLTAIMAGALTLLAVGIYQAGPALPGRMVQAFSLSLKQPPTEAFLTIEVIPPGHIGNKNFIIVSPEDGSFSRVNLANAGPFPEGSVVRVVLKLDHEETPMVSLGKTWARPTADKEKVYETKQVLLEDSTLSIQAGPYIAVSQNLSVIPDDDPSIEFSSIPQVTPRDTIELEGSFSDDHGVREIYLEISGGSIPDSLIGLPFQGPRAGEGREIFFINLLSDPRAGSKVTGRLVALDALGQRAESRPFVLDLPEKIFQNELAKNLADIRKSLLLNPNLLDAQILRLGRYSENPAAFGDNKGVYLALRSVYWKLRSAETDEDFEEVLRFLWQTALTLEDDGSYEEQVLRTLLEDMTRKAFEGDYVRNLEKTSALLRAKARTLFNLEFGQTPRRYSFNSGVQGFELPQVKTFRELTQDLEFQAADNDREAVLATLLESRALFEKMSTPRNGRKAKAES